MSFFSFDENLIQLYVLFLLEYESNSGLVIFCKDHMSGKITKTP